MDLTFDTFRSQSLAAGFDEVLDEHFSTPIAELPHE